VPNSPERPAVRQTRIAVELTTRAAAEVKRCVAQTHALVAVSKFLLQRSATHRSGSPQVKNPDDSSDGV
jgi:hypothetical protein